MSDNTNAARQRRYRERVRAEGMAKFTAWVPEHVIPDLYQAVELLRANPDLTVARLVDRRTGKLRGLR